MKYFRITIFIGRQIKPKMTKTAECSKNSKILRFLDNSCYYIAMCINIDSANPTKYSDIKGKSGTNLPATEFSAKAINLSQNVYSSSLLKKPRSQST